MARTRPCTAAIRAGRMREAENNLADAHALAAPAGDAPNNSYVNLLVLAGVAASDVICCARLDKHSSGESHQEALALLKQAGPELAPALKTLLLLHAYAQLTAHPARLSTIVERARRGGGRDDGAPGPTRGSAQAYLQALRAMMIVDEVEAWLPSLRSRSRFTSVPKRHLVDPSLAASLMGCTPARLLGDIRTLECLFESLATRDLRIYAEAQGHQVFHYQEHSGVLGVDLVVEQPSGGWAGFQVRLGGVLVDEAAAALTRMATTRVAHQPTALGVITATEYCHRRLDRVWVIPLGCLGP
jgi:hypothetical protein